MWPRELFFQLGCHSWVRTERGHSQIFKNSKLKVLVIWDVMGLVDNPKKNQTSHSPMEKLCFQDRQHALNEAKRISLTPGFNSHASLPSVYSDTCLVPNDWHYTANHCQNILFKLFLCYNFIKAVNDITHTHTHTEHSFNKCFIY